MCLAREGRIERFEPLGRVKEQGSGLVTAAQVQGDLTPEPLQHGSVELVQRSCRRGREQRQRGVGEAGEPLGASRSERTPGSPAGLGCQLGCTLQEGSGRGETPTRLRTSGRQLELGGDVLVWCERGVGAMPGAPIGVGLRVSGLCKCPVRAPSLFGRRRAVDRRTQEWMTKRDPRTYRH